MPKTLAMKKLPAVREAMKKLGVDAPVADVRKWVQVQARPDRQCGPELHQHCQEGSQGRQQWEGTGSQEEGRRQKEGGCCWWRWCG